MANADGGNGSMMIYKFVLMKWKRRKGREKHKNRLSPLKHGHHVTLARGPRHGLR
jgi:preprotein translocase subunit YajC